MEGSLFERDDGLDEIALQLLRVAPRERQLAAGRDNLAHIAQPFGERGVLLAGGLPVGPRSREAVVRDAAEEHDVGVVGGINSLAHLLVEVRKVPAAVAGVDHTVECGEQAGRDRRHQTLLS